jgi:OFA family oxalate/formate antiporter-like MFS transporter
MRMEMEEPMAEGPSTPRTSGTSRGWVVTSAGVGINLALGVLYTWSMIKAAIEKDFKWKDGTKRLPSTT